MLKRYFLIFFLSCTIGNLLAQGLHDWQVFTYLNDVRDVEYHDQEIWVGSSGGVYRFNPADSTWQKYSNLDGLKSLDITAVAADQSGNLLFAGRDGIINVYNSLQDTWLANFNMSGQKLVDIYADGNTVWAATDEGVGVFESTGNELSFRDFYNNFSIRPEKAHRIIVFNDFVFYATQNGILYAPSNYVQENLKIAAAWKRLTTGQGLPSDDILDLALVGNVLFVATAGGVVWLDSDLTVHPEATWTGGYVNRIIANDSNLFFISNDEYYQKQGAQWVYIQTLDRYISSGVLDATGELWLGLVNGGLRKYNWSRSFRIDGPGSNHVGVVIKDRLGNVWMTSGKFKLTFGEGFYKYDFKNWTNYKFLDDLWVRKNQTDFVYEDRLGRIWIGSWGGGLTIVSNDTYDYYHVWPGNGRLIVSTMQAEQEILLPEVTLEKRSCLVGAEVRETDNYTVITNFQEDDDKNLWISNYLAREPQYLAVIKNEGNSTLPACTDWIYFGDNIGMDLSDGEISCLEFEKTSSATRLWIGTLSRGVLILDYGNTIDNVSDDRVYRMDVSTDNLFSNTILAIKQDQDGIIWIGTSAGLNSFQNDPSGLNRRVYKHVGEVGPVENKINSIFIDGYNNKWFATDGGLSILQANKSPWDPSAWKNYTTTNSGLPSPVVNSVFVDNQKGAAYLGTEAGFVILQEPFSQYRSNLKEVTSGPNPFLLDGRTGFVIKNLVPNATVKILNLNGHLVRELNEISGDIEGSRAIWDGKDTQDKWVPSGIYFYLIFNEEGLTGTGKISVIKP